VITINPTLRGFIKKEFLQTLRDPRNRVILFIVPAIQLMIFGFAISSDIKNIRLAVPAGYSDFLLDEIRDRAFASGWFIPAQTTRQDPFAVIQADEADAVLVPPPGGLTGSVGRGEGEVQLLINACNVTKAQAVENYLRTLINAVVRQNVQADAARPQIVFDLRVLYNPTMRSSLFLVPAILGLILCLFTIIFTAMAITKEKEQGTFETLIAAPVSPDEILLGKSIPFVIMGLVNTPVTLCAAVFILGVPLRGPLAVFFLSAAVFVCTTVAIGILISTVCRTQQQSMMAGFLFLFPAQLLSGLPFPVENMPAYLKILAYINPQYYYNELLRNIMLKGGEPRLVLTNLFILALMAVVLMRISYSRFKTKL